MRLGASLFLIAVGAVLRFAVTTQRTHGVDVWAIGVILMIVGAVGFAITLLLWSTRRRTDVVYRGDRVTTYAPHDDLVDGPY